MRNLRRQLLLTDPLTTVEKLTNKSILTKSSDDTGKCNTYVLNSKLTKRFSKIKDFVEKFFSDEDLKLNALIIDYSLGYITEEQARELINIIKEIIPYLIHFLLKLFIREEKFMPAIIARAKITISNNLQGNWIIKIILGIIIHGNINVELIKEMTPTNKKYL